MYPYLGHYLSKISSKSASLIINQFRKKQNAEIYLHKLQLRCMGTPTSFPVNLIRGNNFSDLLFTFLADIAHPMIYSLRKEFAPRGANSFLKEETPLGRGSNFVNDSYFPCKCSRC